MGRINKGRPPVPVRFWSKVKFGEGCWEWAGFKRGGYGRFWYGGMPRNAPVVSFMLAYDVWPLHVMHTCDNPGCVRPDHLRMGTIQENMTDRNIKGRLARKYTDAQIREVRAYLDQAVPMKAISEFMKINYLTVYSIAKGTQWSWVN